MSSAKGLLPSCHSFYTILSDPVYGYVSTYLRYYSSLSVCHSVLSILSKGVCKHPSVNRIATGSLYLNYTCWYTLSLIPLLLSFGGVRALTPPKLGGDVDTMSPDQHAKGKCRNPFRLPDFVSGIHARGTREIVISRTSPRILLLHLPPTDPLRRIHSLADSCGGTLGSPAGRSFDPSAEGAMTTARPPLSLIICPCPVSYTHLTLPTICSV